MRTTRLGQLQKKTVTLEDLERIDAMPFTVLTDEQVDASLVVWFRFLGMV